MIRYELSTIGVALGFADAYAPRMRPCQTLVRAAAIAIFVMLAAALRPAPTAAAPGDPCLTGAICADGTLCNGAERCEGGACVLGAPLVCADADPCTRDYCAPSAGCVYAEEACPNECSGAPDGTRCADGTICTRGDVCASGVCVPGAAVACDDGDFCTSERCDPLYGCVYREEAVEFPCLPNCSGAVADYTPCPGDDNICTLDACLPSVDLIGDPHMCIVGLRALERQCGDVDVCNGYEFCSPTLGCQPGPPLVCDDGEVCNGSESCDATLGCQAGTPAADGTGCSDDRLCTSDDACAAGVCAGTPLTPADCSDGIGATGDACVEAVGCVHCLPATTVRTALHVASPARSTLRVRGVLPSMALSGFAPAGESVTVVITVSGIEVTRVTLPAGTLAANSGGTRLLYRELRGTDGAIRQLGFQTRRDGVRWTLRAAGLTLGAPASSVTVRLLLGDACFAGDAACSGPPTNVVCR